MICKLACVPRPAPVGPQLAAFLSTAVGAAKGAATNRTKSDQPASSKLPAQFSSLLGHLVEKKEKSSTKPAETVAVASAGSLPAPPAPPKQELPARGPAAFGLGHSGGDVLPSPPNNLQPENLAGVQALFTAPDFSSSAAAAKPAPNSQPLSISPAAGSSLNVLQNVSSPGISLAQGEPGADLVGRAVPGTADSGFSIDNSVTAEQEETPASPSLVALLGNGFAPVAAGSDSNPQTDSQDVSLLEGLSESSPRPATGAGSTRSQLTPDLTQKPVLSKTKISAGGLQMIDSGWKHAASSQTQLQAELESGLSGGDRGGNETLANSGHSENANAPQSNAGETPWPGSLAFAARLVPLPETPVMAANPSGSAQSASVGSGGQGDAEGSHSPGGATAQVSKDSPQSGPPADVQPAATSSSTPFAMMPSVPQTAAGQIQNNSFSEARPGNNSSPLPSAKDLQGAEPTTTVQAAVPSSARDIHLQLNQGEQRVDVRLSERSGEVHVAVRTPDPQLAGALRDDLPRLSDHLEASGFRAETWHAGLPGTLSGGERRPEAGQSSFSQPQDGGQRQTGQRDPQQQQQPRQPKPGTAQNSNSQRKDFQWLMSQLP
jgi:hypothetical protein